MYRHRNVNKQSKSNRTFWKTPGCCVSLQFLIRRCMFFFQSHSTFGSSKGKNADLLTSLIPHSLK